MCAAAGTCCWLQVTCCTSLACLVIKRIIISCGIQPKKENHTHSHCPAYTYLSLPAHPAALPPLHCCMHFYGKRERAATRCRQKGFSPDQKDATTLLWGMVCNCDQYAVPTPHSPLCQPAGQQAVVVY